MRNNNKNLKKIRELSVSGINKAIRNKEFTDSEVPFDEWAKNEIKNISPEVKSALVEEAVRRAVRKYGEDGLTIDEIVKITGYARSTIQNHLNNLCALREIYSIKRGKRLTLYYPNGKPLWGIGTSKFEIGPSIFEITLARGPGNRLYYHILEKKYTILEGEKAEGGILLPVEGLNNFIEELKKLEKKSGEVPNV